MDRRTYLASFATALAVGAAGCIRETPADDTPEPDPGAESIPTPTPLSGSPRTPNHEDRAQGRPVSIVRSVTDEPGFDDEIEYYPSNRTVRFVEATSGGEPVSFGTWSLEEWGKWETAEIGGKIITDVTVDRLEVDELSELSIVIGVPPDSSSAEIPAITLMLNTDENTHVSKSELIDTAPRSIQVTVSIEGDTYSRIVPVFVEGISVSTLGPLTKTVVTVENTSAD